MDNIKRIKNNIWEWVVKIWKIVLSFLQPVVVGTKKDVRMIIEILTVLVFLIVPFLHNVLNHTLAHWVWYPALLLIFISLIMDWFYKTKPVLNSPVLELSRKWGAITVTFVMISIFVINYYEIDRIWLWIIFVFVAVYSPAFFISLLTIDIKQEGKIKEKHQRVFINICKNIILYWFLDLFYMSVFNYWFEYIENHIFNTTWLTLQFVFGILSLVIISFNLTNAFLNGAESLWVFMALELIIALIVCGYLIYIVPNCEIQEIVLTIVSAMIGGILTLVGVAWTIKDTNEKRLEDLQRMEKERKEEERKKYVPLVNLFTDMVLSSDCKIYASDLYFSSSSEGKRYRVESFYLKNTDFTSFYISGIYFNKYEAKCKCAIYIDKQKIVEINLGEDVIIPEKLFSMGIHAKDLLGNTYKIPLDFSIVEKEQPTKINIIGCFWAEYIDQERKVTDGKTE